MCTRCSAVPSTNSSPPSRRSARRSSRSSSHAADAPTTFRGKVLREAAGAAAVLGFQPSTRFTGPVENRLAEPVAGRLLTALRRALAAASRRAGVSRVEITVDVTAPLPDGRPGVRLTVFDDGGAGTTVTWRWPL